MAANNDIEKAVALLYRESDHKAPQVVASGRGETAMKIVQLARESGVDIVSDPDLVDLLAKTPPPQEIPHELYQAVAEILAFVYEVNKSYSEGIRPANPPAPSEI